MSDVEGMISRLDIYFGNRYSGDTVANTKSQGRRFLEKMGARRVYSRPELLAYIDHLIAAGYKRRSIQVITGCVKTLLIANEIPWPLTPRDLHLGMAKGEVVAPALPGDDIIKLIRAVSRLGPPSAPAVALSTTWGLRSTEITAVLNAGCNGLALVVQTAKGGEVRSHEVPPELRGAMDFPPYAITRDGVQKMFDRLMAYYVRQPLPREGWHAIRRSVVTALIAAGLEDRLIYRYMGWRRPNQMTDRYWISDGAVIDHAVYAAHPWIGYWPKLPGSTAT